MPSQPPTFRPKAAPQRRTKGWASTSRESRQARGYGRAHELMRARVLVEEPVCRICAAAGRIAASTIADHITPKAEGGTDDRSNYQGVCAPCHRAKTAEEAARGRRG